METTNPGSLKNKFENFGSNPTNGLWNSIEKNLAEDKKKRGFFWWWFSGIAAGISVLIFTYYLGYQAAKNDIHSPNNLTQKNHHNSNQLQTDIDNSHYETNVELKNQNSVVVHENETNSENLNGTNQVLNNIDNTQPNKTTAILVLNDNLIQPESKDKKEHLTTNQNDEKSELSERTHNTKQEQKPSIDLTEILSKPYSSKWEISFGYNYSNHLFNAKSNYLVADNGSFADLTSGENWVDNSGVLESTNSAQPSFGKIARPINFQLCISYHLNKRIYLASGLGLNYFKVSSFSSVNNFETKSNYFSASIPFWVGLKFINRTHFESAFETGINYEIPFYYSDKKVATTSFIENNSKGFIFGNMFSANSGLTFAYKTKNQFKIGLNVGINHYFYQSVKTYIPIPEQNSWWTAGIRLSKSL